MNGLRVGIAGAGSVAMGTAALLHVNGHDPMLWSPSGRGTSELAIGADLAATGAIDAVFCPRLATVIQMPGPTLPYPMEA